MVVALVVESRRSRQSKKTQQMSHCLPNSKHSQQETTHSTRPSWNLYVSSQQPNVRLWSLNSSDHGFTKRENSHLQCTPTFRPLLLALPLRVRFLFFHLSRPYVSCAPFNPYADVQVCCTRDKVSSPFLPLSLALLALSLGASQCSIDIHGHIERGFRTKKIHHCGSHCA